MKVGKLEKIKKRGKIKAGKMGRMEKAKKSSEKLVKVKDKFQVTIPNLIREILCVEEGDVLEVTIINRMIVFKPKIVVDRDSAQGGPAFGWDEIRDEGEFDGDGEDVFGEESKMNYNNGRQGDLAKIKRKNRRRK